MITLFIRHEDTAPFAFCCIWLLIRLNQPRLVSFARLLILPYMDIAHQISLKDFNTFGVNSTAKIMVRVLKIDDLQNVLQDPKLKDENRLILGGGSNLLFTRALDALVIKIDIPGRIILSEDEQYAVVETGAGENWHKFVRWTIDQNLGGLENLSLIPGNVGASPMQNIGAYGVEIKDSFHSLSAVNLATGETEEFDKAACEFGYRESIFKRSLKNQYAIVKVRYQLKKQPTFNTSYGAIEQELDRMGISELSLDAISRAVMNIRQSKLPDPNVLGNAGSFFKNPTISENAFQEIIHSHPDIPHYPAAGETYKLAAGWMIEQCGWKGKRTGNCGMHEKQALVLVNYGGATGEEIYNLSEQVLQSVKRRFGIELEREVNVL